MAIETPAQNASSPHKQCEVPDRDFSLERAELEMVLSGKCNECMDFTAAAKSAAAATGNDYLFPLPPESFPLKAASVAAIRLSTLDGAGVAYVYETASDGPRRFIIADNDELDRSLIDFAQNYADLLCQLKNLFHPIGPEALH